MLSVDDLETYTQGRLSAGDEQTQWVFDSALQELQNYCRWHVAPIHKDVTMDLDGPGQWGGLSVGVGGLYQASGGQIMGTMRRGRYGADTLYLPTKHLRSIVAIVEDGVPLDLSTIIWSRSGAVQKLTGQLWTPNRAGSMVSGATGLQVTFTHGYSEDEATDWCRLVLAIADRMSMVRGLVGPFNVALGPYRTSAYYGTSRTGTMPRDAGWLDDLMAQVDSQRYVRMDV